MKIIAIGDIHASGFSDDPIVNGYPKRLEYIRKSLEYIIDYGINHDIKTFVMVGDIYNDKTIIYNEAQNMLCDIFGKYYDCKFIMFSGNHDLSSVGENQKSGISVFTRYDNVNTILYKPETIPEINGLVVPYCHDFISVYKESLKIIKSYDTLDVMHPQILFAHVGLNEGVLQSGLSKVDKLKISDISYFPLAILGHYHKPQDLGNSNTKVYYVGSLIPKDWNDKNEEKRFLVVDTDSLEVESVPLNVDGVAKFYEFIITENTTESERKTIFEQAAQLKNEGHHVRVVNKSKQKVSKEESISDMVVLENTEVDITDRGISITQSKIEQCEKYLDIKKIDKKDEYLKILKDKNLLEITQEK